MFKPLPVEEVPLAPPKSILNDFEPVFPPVSILVSSGTTGVNSFFGGAIGAYLAGVYWMDGLGAQQTFIYAGYVALFASVIAFLMSNKKAPM